MAFLAIQSHLTNLWLRCDGLGEGRECLSGIVTLQDDFM